MSIGIKDILAMVDKLPKLPPVDTTFCMSCRGPLGDQSGRIAITTSPHFLASPVGYICPACGDRVRRALPTA
ncbi:MAG: hypothetical protein QM754_00595 [Tepidisphaeraceae bacterium]